MRIGIDARELAGHATGAGRYLAGLLGEWARDARAPRHEFVLYAAEPPAATLDARRFASRVVPGTPGTWWEQVRLPAVAARDHLDVWFSPAYSIPLRLHVPRVVAIHDVSFVAHPEWFGAREGIRRRWLCRAAVERAAAIVTISEFSRQEIRQRLGVPAGKIHVIPPGVEVPSHQAPATRPQLDGNSTELRPGSPNRQRREGGSHPRVLFVGSIFNRRHVPDLIRAFAPIARAHPGASLAIVGDNRSTPLEDLRGAIAAEGVQAQVFWHEYVSDDRLRELYAGARAFAFLSEYEGLGLTPLEALAAGVPAVLLDTPVARESCQDAALYVPPNDLAATTRALETALFDNPARARLLAAAPVALAKYDWPRAARETLAVLERCVS
ncbi:MAG: glycosyltransferase family 4 protein [Acidobacteria bacterium]|nr:glycosyltransferase family 4 protein [Acidobacteriota bacterium]